MLNQEIIIAEILLKYNISTSTAKKLKEFLSKAENYKYLYFMTETIKPKVRSEAPNETTKKIEISTENTDEIYLPPREYLHKNYNAEIFSIAEKGEKHKLHYHRLIATNQRIDYKEVQKKFRKSYYLHFEILNFDDKTIKKVIEYMFKKKKKDENQK
ncbi:hypothetical protein ARV3_gp06 [Acidianus rod-shaped virus 3]|uniref:Uncharacterized protein n=1 Tax=Acidianus rod-shaped virus 3 TaxID=2730617 RepID=A0A6M3VYY8_9VIRU|nr:hypothetical protein QIT28_gp06 [Acidianus rod-shaped virus 3]QJF12319.1 hypothetical protein ARV3_gp06 [Acidianus rod-shaped virus 3]